jgi:hypothetical protein
MIYHTTNGIYDETERMNLLSREHDESLNGMRTIITVSVLIE